MAKGALSEYLDFPVKIGSFITPAGKAKHKILNT